MTDTTVADDVAEKIRSRVAVEPICLHQDDDLPGDVPGGIRLLLTDLLYHGEVSVVTEEKAEGTELHAGNTEFDFENEAIVLDTRQDIITIPFDRVIDHDIHFDA